MKLKSIVLTVSVITTIVPGLASSEPNLRDLGVEKNTYDNYNTRTKTYSKELGRTRSGNEYGVYGNTSSKYKNYGGERDTTANQVQGSGSISGGVYIRGGSIQK